MKHSGNTTSSNVKKAQEAVEQVRSAKRVDQFRKEFQAWITRRLNSLESERVRAVLAEEWMRAGGLAIQMDELEAVKSAVIDLWQATPVPVPSAEECELNGMKGLAQLAGEESENCLRLSRDRS